MRVVRKKKDKWLLIALLTVALAMLIGGAVLINHLLKPDTGGGDDIIPPEILEGEDIYNNIAIAYPRIEEDKIIAIQVMGEDDGNNYSLVRKETEKDGKTELGGFILSYTVNGETRTYDPQILANDPDTDYDDLYALEQNDQYGVIPKLTYLCTAIGTPYFKERIELSTDAAKKDEQLRTYGLTKSSAVSIGFIYVDKDGKEDTHVITIGDPMITGYGYYFMVDDREYVYSVENNDYFKYALASFTSFVKPVLTAAGLKIDGAFEPYLTTGFEQWKNTLYDDAKPESEDGDGVDTVKDGATVTVTGSLIMPSDKEDDGYRKDSYRGVSLDMTDVQYDELYRLTVAALLGKPLGALADNAHITVTLSDNGAAKKIDAGKLAAGITYVYTVSAIESVIDGDGEHTAAGYSASGAKYIKVTYTAKAGGVSLGDKPLHAVIRTDDEVLPESARTALLASSVGELSTPIVFSVDYTVENSIARNIVITEIITILDENNKALDKVVTGSSVMFRYKYEVNGVQLESEGTEVLEIKDGLTGQDKLIADALLGRYQSKELKVIIPDGNYELMHQFVSYDISELRYFTTKENIVSFEFQQASDRDPYYGESLYKNNTIGKYHLYALNSTACESVVKMLGGIESDSSQSLGISGIETLAVGLTPEVMKAHGLYAYTVYFELPRGITAIKGLGSGELSSADELDKLDDYTWYSTLGFTLYISEEYKEGGVLYRNVGSDLYDIVAKCPAESFEFLNHGFVDFYARRNIMLTDISSIYNIKFDFLMEDIYGSYDNEFLHEILYNYNGEYYLKSELTDEQFAASRKYDAIDIFVTPSEGSVSTEFSKFLAEKGYTSSSLYEFYDKKLDGIEKVGTANFKELTELIFYTYYEGYMTEEEQAAAFAEGKHVMTMTVTLGEEIDGSYQTHSAFDYVYEFYRVSDRRIAVKLYRQNRVDGSIAEQVSDFYISTFSFKKIVNAYMGILNKQMISNDTPYTE